MLPTLWPTIAFVDRLPKLKMLVKGMFLSSVLALRALSQTSIDLGVRGKVFPRFGQAGVLAAGGVPSYGGKECP